MVEQVQFRVFRVRLVSPKLFLYISRVGELRENYTNPEDPEDSCRGRTEGASAVVFRSRAELVLAARLLKRDEAAAGRTTRAG